MIGGMARRARGTRGALTLLRAAAAHIGSPKQRVNRLPARKSQSMLQSYVAEFLRRGLHAGQATIER